MSTFTPIERPLMAGPRLPDSWSALPLKFLLIANDSGVWGEEPDGTGDVVVLRSTDQTVNGEWNLGEPALRKLSLSEKFRYRLRCGDLLVTKSSGSSSHIGKTTIVGARVEQLEAVYSNFMQRLTLGRDSEPRFYWYWMRSRDAREQLRLSSTTTTGLANLTGGTLGNLIVPSPPLVVQRRIVSFLDRQATRIDALIGKQEQLIKTLHEQRDAVIADAVLGRGRTRDTEPSGTPWIGEIPVGWSIRPLWSMFSREKNVGFPDEPMISVYRDYGVIFKDSRANLNQTAENRDIYQLIEPGWLVCNRMKAWQGSVGVSGLRGIVSGHYICFRPTHQEDARYLNWLFRSKPYISGYQTISRGVRPGQAEIDNDWYRVLPVIVPPIRQQRQIAAYLVEQTSKIDDLVGRTLRFIDLSRERRAALISAAVTGQIDVSGAAYLDDELSELGEGVA